MSHNDSIRDSKRNDFIDDQEVAFVADSSLYPCDDLDIDPRAPTMASPGSDEKVQVLAARYAAGEDLWHRKDNTNYDGGSSAKQVPDTEKADDLWEDEEEEMSDPPRKRQGGHHCKPDSLKQRERELNKSSSLISFSESELQEKEETLRQKGILA